MIVLLDSNILFSALISPIGAPRAIYDAWLRGRFRLVTCRAGELSGTELTVTGGKLQDVRDVGGPLLALEAKSGQTMPPEYFAPLTRLAGHLNLSQLTGLLDRHLSRTGQGKPFVRREYSPLRSIRRTPVPETARHARERLLESILDRRPDLAQPASIASQV